MVFNVKDFETKKMLKEIKLNKEDSITFKNTSIVQEGGGFGLNISGDVRTRELEKTSKFLRKVSRSNAGIAVFKTNGIYQIVLGGHIEASSGGVGMMPMAGGGFGGMAGGQSFTIFSPIFGSYGGYSSSKSTVINCLFNDKFEHVKGKLPENIFDKIDAYDTEKGDLKLKTVFKHNEKFYLGHFDKKTKHYRLIGFDE